MTHPTPALRTSIVLLLVAGVVALAVSWLLWPTVAPAAEAGAPVEVGPVRQLRWTNDGDRRTTFAWEYELNVSGDPGAIVAHPRFPYRLVQYGGPEGGDSVLKVDLRVSVNGVEAYRMVNTIPYAPGTDAWSGKLGSFEDTGAPADASQVRQGLLHRGVNVVRAVVELHLDVEHQGSGYTDITLGPVRSEVSGPSGGGLGGPILQGIPSRVLPPMGGLLAGAAAWALLRVARRRFERQP